MGRQNPPMRRLYDTGVRYFTPGTWILVVLAWIFVGIAFARFFFGLSAVTNFDDDYPWGIWKGINIASFIALGAAGFTMAFISHIYGRHQYSPLVRRAIVFAMLCYTFAPISLIVDLGRYWAFWHPIFPLWWQGNSVLFEVAMCVMLYLLVLIIEFVPFVVEHYRHRVALPGILRIFNRFAELILWLIEKTVMKVLFVFVILGVVLSCLHQSSLGSLMIIAGTKLHPLWQTPMLPLLYLVSAISVGFPVIAFISLTSTYSFHQDPETGLLQRLLLYTPFLLGIYIILKIYDLIHRGALGYLAENSIQSFAFMFEMALVIAGCVMFSIRKVRETPAYLTIASAITMLAIIFNRENVMVTGFRPPGLDHVYVPTFWEVLFTIGLISSLILVYRFIVIYVPIFGVKQDVSAMTKAPGNLAASSSGGGS